MVKKGVGLEYEFVLTEHLRALGVPFWTEVGLRSQNEQKTPDVRLLEPLLVNGAAVNWIESKALFGDEYVKKKEKKNE